MDKKYLDGHVSLVDPEGMPGHLYRVQYNNGQHEWLFVDENEATGNFAYWHFDVNKKLLDGGEFECGSTLTEDILHEACEWADIPDAAIEELEDSYLSIEDLANDGFRGM